MEVKFSSSQSLKDFAEKQRNRDGADCRNYRYHGQFEQVAFIFADEFIPYVGFVRSVKSMTMTFIVAITDGPELFVEVCGSMFGSCYSLANYRGNWQKAVNCPSPWCVYYP